MFDDASDSPADGVGEEAVAAARALRPGSLG
jgi:hypothetical protein